MLKKSSLLLVFIATCLRLTMVFATTPEVLCLQPVANSNCETPPPANFQVEALGSGFVVLAWEPYATNALHTITVSEVDNNGNPLLIQTFEHVAGPALQVNDIEPGVLYTFTIATECADGTRGPEDRISQAGLIIELTINGNPPSSPEPVECDKIPYKIANWVGFRVETPNKNGGVISNIFQVTFNQPGSLNEVPFDVKVKRVSYNNLIVATNEEDAWPIITDPFLDASNPFKMKIRENLVDGNLTSDPIGRVMLQFDHQYLTLCPTSYEDDVPWDSKFEFFPIFSTPGVDNIGDDRNEDEADSTNAIFKYNSIVSEALILQTSAKFVDNKKVKICIFNPTGDILQEVIMPFVSQSIDVPCTDIPQGSYILTAQSEGYFFSGKLIKI
jgi:hypothetical protein